MFLNKGKDQGAYLYGPKYGFHPNEVSLGLFASAGVTVGAITYYGKESELRRETFEGTSQTLSVSAGPFSYAQTKSYENGHCFPGTRKCSDVSYRIDSIPIPGLDKYLSRSLSVKVGPKIGVGAGITWNWSYLLYSF